MDTHKTTVNDTSTDYESSLLDRLLDSRYALRFSVHPHECGSYAREDLADKNFDECFVLVQGLVHKKINMPQEYTDQDNKFLNDLLYRIGEIKRTRVPDEDLVKLQRELIKVFELFRDLTLMPLSLEVLQH